MDAIGWLILVVIVLVVIVLRSLHDCGQAVWLDFLARRFIAEGGLKKLIEQDGLTGMTSNPSIFEKAIGGSVDYDSAMKAAESQGDCDVMALYEPVATDHATDLEVPDQKYTFGVVEAAEARGDFEVLAERDRRALRVHLGTHVAAGLTTLREAIRQAFA